MFRSDFACLSRHGFSCPKHRQTISGSIGPASRRLFSVSVRFNSCSPGGERLDWFDSTEIVVEAMVAAGALWVFLMHTLTAKRSFIERSLFRSRNFNLGLIFIFLIGAVLFLPLLLLPLMMQQISGYPAIEIGNVMLPRGLGAVLGLVLMAQLRDKVDPAAHLSVRLSTDGPIGMEDVELDGRGAGDRRCLGHLHPRLRNRRGLGAAQHAGSVQARQERSRPRLRSVLPEFRYRQRSRDRRR